MGVVYSATQVSMDRRVAVKLLQTKLSEDETMHKRFEQEAKSISSLRHPNIITIFDYGRTEDDRLFMVMELLSGESLHTLLQNRRLTSAESLDILHQVAGAVAEAHRQGVVHRDLKPENIHLEQVGGQAHFVKVLDFGIAKIIHGDGRNALDQPVTQAGVVFGTPHYMSPEQIHGKAIDHRSDIYALGILLYELITGTLPFQGCSNIEAMLAQVSREFPDVRLLCPERQHIEALAQLIADCTERDVDARVQSANALQERIEALLPLVREDTKRPKTPGESVSPTAETALSEPLAIGERQADAAPFDFNYTVGGDEVEHRDGVHLTPTPFTGQLNPTGTEAALEDKASSGRWSLLLLVCAALLGAWALLHDPGQGSRQSQAVQPTVPVPVDAPTAPSTTRYSLSSTPSGATVRRGERTLGETPLSITVTAGAPDDVLSFSKVGHQTETRTLVAAAEPQRAISVELTPLKAWFRLNSVPTGAQVRIDGVLIGVTPLEWRPQLTTTKAEVEFNRPGYTRSTRVLSLTPAGTSPEVHEVKLRRIPKKGRPSSRVKRPGKTPKAPKRSGATTESEKKIPKRAPKPKTTSPSPDDGFDKL